MPDIDIVDSTWIRAELSVVAAEVADRANWARWWPTLALDVTELRGVKGARWDVTTDRGAFRGTMEVWLQPQFDGVVVHYFLRLAPRSGPQLSRGRSERLGAAHRRRAKQAFWALGDQLDPTRTVTSPTWPTSRRSR